MKISRFTSSAFGKSFSDIIEIGAKLFKYQHFGFFLKKKHVWLLFLEKHVVVRPLSLL